MDGFLTIIVTFLTLQYPYRICMLHDPKIKIQTPKSTDNPLHDFLPGKTLRGFQTKSTSRRF